MYNPSSGKSQPEQPIVVHQPMLTIQFLDVGQGDGIFIVFPNDATMLIDLGSTKNKQITGPDLLTYFRNHTRFRDRGQTLDYLILTHGDRDHYNMVEQFLQEFAVKVRHYAYGGKREEYGALINKLENTYGATPATLQGFNQLAGPFTDARIQLPAQLGDQNLKKEFGDAIVWCWAIGRTPDGGGKRSGYAKNSDSLVLQLVYSGVRVLLTGDATLDTELAMLAAMQEVNRYPGANVVLNLTSNVLKVAHHGSTRTSNAPGFIAAVDPEFVFLSADRSGSLDEDERTGHRHPQEITLDIIRQYARSLYKGCEPHNCVSSYDPEDYSKIGEHASPQVRANPLLGVPQAIADPHQAQGWTRGWHMTRTPEGIFTSIIHMGIQDQDPTELAPDFGCQYEVRIFENSLIQIFATDGPETVAHQVVVK